MKHYDYLCKYDPGTALPAIAFKKCDECDAFLCPSCGYEKKYPDSVFTFNYCNECYAKVRAEDPAFFPPQGEPGGNPEPELTRAEADERERSAHTHPTS